MSTATGAAAADKRLSLLRVLGPAHVWALGVGIVLVGEYMGWNFSVGKGGMIAGLIACWVAGLLYTCVAMIDSEVTSTVAAAGGQYAQAKHIVGPAHGLQCRPLSRLRLHHARGRQRHHHRLSRSTRWPRCRAIPALNQKPFIILTIMFLAWLNYRGVLTTLNFNFVITAIAFLAIIILFFAVEGRRVEHAARLQRRSTHRTIALWLDRRARGAAFRPVVLSRHRGHHPGGRGSALAGARAALSAPWPASSRCSSPPR